MEAENIIGIAKAIVVIPAIFWLIFQFGMPRRYWKDDRLPFDGDRLSTLAKWQGYGGVIILFVGLLFIAYDATDAVMDWMPRSWGGVDEDGEWRAMRPGLQGTIAFFIACLVLESAGKRAEASAKWPVDHAFALAIIEDLESQPWKLTGETGNDYRLRIIRAGRGVLKQERYDDAFDLKEYRTRLIERLTAVEERIETGQK